MKSTKNVKKSVMTIAGSDSSGGAGIQADLKTMCAHGVFGTSAITALTAQNTCGVKDVYTVAPKFLAEEIDEIYEDIPPDAVKIGMISNAEIANQIADSLEKWHAKHVVLDTVMVATSGAVLLEEDAANVLVTRLMPLAEIITPNIPEAKKLSGVEIVDKDSMAQAAKAIVERTGYQGAVLVKGGHQISDADDYLLYEGKGVWLNGKHIDNPNTHGTGCTLSSAIASNLALGHDLVTSVKMAKEYISGALAAMLDLGKCSGPLDHMYVLDDLKEK